MSIAHDISEETHRSTDVFNDNNIGQDFDSFLLTPKVLQGLKECGFVHPSPIQVQAIPLSKCGVDLVCQAKSGTGKTCVLAVCTLETIDVNNNVIQALILAPTREVAHQIHSVVTSIGCFIDKLQCGLFIGGLPIEKDIENLKHCHVAIATPGRVKSLIEKGHFSTQSIRLYILDEADKLLEKGSFQQQINWIFSTLPKDKQMLALSATYPETLAEHLNNYMKDPVHVRINPQDVALKGVVQFYKTVKHHALPNKLFDSKYKVLVEILQKLPFQQCMIFSNLHSRAEHLSRKLISQGWPTTFISGTQVQKERLKAIDKLKKFHCRVLITTDLTSRGIDCDKVNLVINLDLPWDHETYLHRVGRAGRFGSNGVGISLVSEVGEKETFFKMTRMLSRRPKLLPEADKLSTLWSDIASYQDMVEEEVEEVVDERDSLKGEEEQTEHDTSSKVDVEERSEEHIQLPDISYKNISKDADRKPGTYLHGDKTAARQKIKGTIEAGNIIIGDTKEARVCQTNVSVNKKADETIFKEKKETQKNVNDKRKNNVNGGLITNEKLLSSFKDIEKIENIRRRESKGNEEPDENDSNDDSDESSVGLEEEQEEYTENIRRYVDESSESSTGEWDEPDKDELEVEEDGDHNDEYHTSSSVESEDSEDGNSSSEDEEETKQEDHPVSSSFNQRVFIEKYYQAYYEQLNMFARHQNTFPTGTYSKQPATYKWY